MAKSSCCYGFNLVERYAKNHERDLLTKVFLLPSMIDFLKSNVPGKKVLDIGCGDGYWSCQAAKCGAKSVTGFDIQEDMVTVARKTTSTEFSGRVHIQVGDVISMPYDNGTFDIAMVMYVTCGVPVETLTKLFTELYRVLVPGGKAVIVNLSDNTFNKLYLLPKANEKVIDSKIERCLKQIPTHPTTAQINKALEDLHEIGRVCLAKDCHGCIYRITDVSQLQNGEPTWNKTPMIAFPNFFYKGQFLAEQTISAGFCIDQIENFHTEERRLVHNRAHPDSPLSEIFTKQPMAHLYHLSKPLIK